MPAKLAKFMKNFCGGKRRGFRNPGFRIREIKGEITLLIGKPARRVEDGNHVEAGDSPARLSIGQRVEQLMEDEKADEKAALKKIAKERGNFEK